MSSSHSPSADRRWSGVLHVNAAFDWGDEIDLEQARQLGRAETHTLPRKPRTPPSIGYQPSPLRYSLPDISLSLPVIGKSTAQLDATAFDFGALSAAVHVPFELPADKLVELAGALANSTDVVEPVRRALQPLFETLRCCIKHAHWHELTEEYFVFQLRPDPACRPEMLVEHEAAWLASLVRLEPARMSTSEVAEALRQRLTYTPDDLLVVDWAAAVLIDEDCSDTLEVIAFANLQLLEFRYIDSRLDAKLDETYRLMQKFASTWLPFWRTHSRQLRSLGELNVEVNVMLERSANALNLVGDPYLARAFQLFSARFHLDEWGQGVRRSISVLEGIYKVVSDQAATYRAELLEITIILLILFEIVMAFWKR